MSKSKERSGQSEHQLVVRILIGIFLGVLAGGIFGERILFLKLFGALFLRALRMVAIPLVVTSIVTGVASLGDPRKLGRLGLRTAAYYLSTTLLAVVTGLLLVNIIQPGVGAGHDAASVPERLIGKQTTLEEMALSFIPANVFEAAAQGEILPLITFSILLGLALAMLGPKGGPALPLIAGLNEAIMVIVHWVIRLSPVGIGCLVAGKFAEVGGLVPFSRELAKIGWYFGTVVLGLAIHGGGTLIVLLVLLGKRSPADFVRALAKALATAFGTASSSATLPVTMECLERNAKVHPRIVSFVVPLGATVNMDGTALYEAVAALFVAQAYGIHLTFTQQITVAVTATLASIGAAGIPEAGLVMMVMVFGSVGLPLEGISMILLIDWFLDRFRTTVNVWGDCVGAAVMDRMEADGTSEP